MARKKYIDNQELLLLFEHYLLEHCSNNPRLFKIHSLEITLEATDFRRLQTQRLEETKNLDKPLMIDWNYLKTTLIKQL